MWFMLYGGWEEKATAEIADGELVAADFAGRRPKIIARGSSSSER